MSTIGHVLKKKEVKNKQIKNCMKCQHLFFNSNMTLINLSYLQIWLKLFHTLYGYTYSTNAYKWSINLY